MPQDDRSQTADEAWFLARALPSVRSLGVYDPGHDLEALRDRFSGSHLVELGANENPYGPSPAARGAVLDQLHMLHRYPDPRGGSLKRALAAHHGIDPASILLGNGSHELLMQLAQVFSGRGDEVVCSRFGFAVFALAAKAAGAECRIADALPDSGDMPLGHDLETLLVAITPKTRLVYLANPNNPTGTWFGRQALVDFLSRVPSETIVVVDEAYAEMADAPDYASAVGLLASHRNLVVTRTFSKAYGLAGLRLGCLMAAPGLVAVMERVRETFNVSGPALAAGEAALADHAHLQWVRAGNAEQRIALGDALRDRGLKVFPSQTNFLLVDFGSRAVAVETGLLASGVVLRPMAGYGLPQCLRITIGTRDENRRLLAALDEVPG